MNKFLVIIFTLLFFFSCQNEASEPAHFQLLTAKQTGLYFSNDVENNQDLNIFNYMYFYNGGGVGAGDFNQDGLIDLFFSANLKANQLFLNKGDFKFEEVSETAKIPKDKGWSAGVSVVDINNDGRLDIYISQVGEFRTLKGKNQLLVCVDITEDGIPIFEDQAAQYGLDIVGFCTQAAFFDFDLDGDLDLYQMKHSLHDNGTFGQRKTFKGKYDELSGDKIFRNDNGKFINITENAGINSWVIGYGLGLAMGDVNVDGFPDIYVGNDFHENDYLYLNQKNATFKEVLTEQMMHTSRFSMGVDIADLNNDAQPEIISLDMLPYDPYILKKSEGEEAYGTFDFKLGYGYNHQYAKNAIQINNGNGTFSEVAMFGGVHATDWSWASLFLDFDNDGFKDVFISNGIPKRMNDIDYINFTADSDFQWKNRMDVLEKDDLGMIEQIPEIKLPNKFFHHNGQFQFEDIEKKIKNNQSSFSNGAVYADLNNDGKLDIVVNNVNDQPFIYRNTSPENTNTSLTIHLIGSEENRQAIGAKIIVIRKDSTVQLVEHFPVRGFQSSMQVPLHIGLGNVNEVNKIYLVWPDNSVEEISDWQNQQVINRTHQTGLSQFDYSILKKKNSPSFPGKDLTTALNIDIQHKENPFVEFNRELLIPHSTSTDGPALTVGDLNNDGKEDVFFGSGKRKRSHVLLKESSGFRNLNLNSIAQDSIYEDVDAVMADVNNDGNLDVIVATGGNEYSLSSKYLLQRVYLGDGKGNLTLLKDAIPDIKLTASSVVAEDFTGDGHIDLFFGGRAVPSSYGEIPSSYLLENDGSGHFKDITDDYHEDLSKIGFVTHATCVDLNKDGQKDLILSLEWGNIIAFLQKGNRFEKQVLTSQKGWWNFTLPYDFDADGDIDLIAGNLGFNSRLKASDKQPVQMYYNDFDGNGKREQVLTYYLQDREIPFSNMMEMQKQMPFLKKKFLYAKDFAKASLTDLFGEKLKEATRFEANHFANSILINQGDGTFLTEELPLEAQRTPYKTAVVIDANGDDRPDVLLGGNYYHNNIQMGRMDADYGTLLINEGDNNFEVTSLNGLSVKGQIRRIRSVELDGKMVYILAINDEKARVIQFEK